MPFVPKDWQDLPSTATPLSAAALEDLETRVAASAVTLDPESSTRNIAQPSTSSAVPLVLRGAVGQTADLQQWQDSAGTVLGAVTAAGQLQFGGDAYLYRNGANSLKTDGGFVVGTTASVGGNLALSAAGAFIQRNAASTATAAAVIRVVGDTFDRIVIRGDGKLDWGPGNASLDTNLYRSAADTLSTDDSFHIGLINFHPAGLMTLKRGAAATTTAIFGYAADTGSRFVITNEGRFAWGDGTAGTDTNLYRSAADTLKTDDTFQAAVLAVGTPAVGDNLHVGTATRYLKVPSTRTTVMRYDDNATNTGPLRLDNFDVTPAFLAGAELGFRLSGDGTAGVISSAIRSIKTTEWTTTASTQNASLNFFTASAGAIGTAKLTITPAGQVQVPVTGNTGGLLIGGDTNLYRAAADHLKTDDQLQGDLQTLVASVTTARTGGAAATLPVQPVKYLALRDETGARVYVPAYS